MAKKPSATDNAVNRAVREQCEIARASDNIRANLAAVGVPRRVINVLVELGVQKQKARLNEALDSALEQSEKSQGAGAIDRETLKARVDDLVRLEEDSNHMRQVARGQGLDPRALAILSQLVQSNPGDGGERSVNTLLAYARAAGISLEGVPTLSAELTAPPPSVMPRVARDKKTTGQHSRAAMIRDAVIGSLIGIVVIVMLA